MNEKSTNDIPISEEELIEIRKAYHSLEAFQLSPEHREAKAALKARLVDNTSDSSGKVEDK